VADPENSVFYDYWKNADAAICSEIGSRVEGIGRPRVEPSFLRTVVDHMIQVPDAGSFAAMLTLTSLINKRVGGSSGTNFFGVVELAREMRSNGQSGSIVTLICDSGERYLNTYYNPEWLERNGLLDEVRRQKFIMDLI